MSIDERFDVGIVGGGVVGMCLALALGRAGWRVVIVEASAARPRLPAGQHDLQVLALSLASSSLLQRLGAWGAIPAARVGPYARMVVWDALGAGRITFRAEQLGQRALGHVVEQAALLEALELQLHGATNVQWRRPEEVRGLTGGADAVRADCSGGTGFRASLIVGADGARSTTRRLAGIDVRLRPYGQRAVVSTVRLSAGHRDTAWQAFLATGPVAVLPLAPSDTATVVWSAPAEYALELETCTAATFCARLQKVMRAELGQVHGCAARRSFPLERLWVPRYVAGRVVLIGDAAHQIHPLAGQGANLGLLDAAALAECVGAAAAGRDPGSLRGLQRFQRWRKTHNAVVQSTMDIFDLLFGQRPLPVRLLRNVGLSAVDECAPVKSWLARQACGLAGHLPELSAPLGRTVP